MYITETAKDKVLEFACEKCGCIFTADDRDDRDYSEFNHAHLGHWIEIIPFPCCGNLIQRG